MRITQSISTRNFLDNVRRAERRLDGANEQLSTGRRLTRASDDPIGLSQSVRLRETRSRIEHNLESIGAARSELSITEEAVQSAQNLLNEALLTAQQAMLTDDVGEPTLDLEILASEAQATLDNLVAVSETRIGDRYIFSGTATDAPPYDDQFVYQGNDGSIEAQIDATLRVGTNVRGDELFEGSGNVFVTLQGLVAALQDNDLAALQAVEQQLHAAVEAMGRPRGQVGERLASLDGVEERLTAQSTHLLARISEIEDADIAEAATEVALAELGLEATLSAGAQIDRPNLLDFLG